MRDAVRFILERMDTHPHEFIQGSRSVKTEAKHNWISAINEYKKFFNEEEKNAVQSKLSEINLEQMKGYITEKLLASEEENDDPYTLSKESLADIVKAFKETEEAKHMLVNQQQIELIKDAIRERNI